MSPTPLDYAEPALYAARREIARNGRALNTAQYVRSGTILLTVFFGFGSPESKARSLELVGRAGRSVGADLILLTTDVYLRTVTIPEGTDPEAAMRDEMEHGPLPSEDPEATDALVVQGITAAGIGWQVVQPYHRADDGTVRWEQPVEQVPGAGATADLVVTGLRGKSGAPTPVLARVLGHFAHVGPPPMVMAHNDEIEGMLQ